jgi:biotin operon repressor
MSVWSKISDEKKFELLMRRYVDNEEIGGMAQEVGMNPITLNRQLQRLRSLMDEEQPEWREAAPAPAPKPRIEFPPERELPSYPDMFQLLRKGPVSLDELSRKFDRSKETIGELISRMEAEGYVIERTRNTVEISPLNPAIRVDYKPARTLADEVGHEITFGVASDAHFGSSHAQVSARNRFIRMAYEEYGVRHIFDPGDLTAGVNGYRGQEYDLIPSLRPRNGKDLARVTDGQIWLADSATPRLPGLTYYELGGNHDYWHIANTGIDAVGKYCRQREDSVFLGYDVADIPLTDRVAIRLWHPSGGVPYSLSYRLQKGLEQLAFDELTRAVEQNENPKVRFLLAGHLHVEVKFHRGPLVAAQVGCFEGQTNYLKRKGLYPSIGGAIFRVRVTDSGMVQRVEYTFVPFSEVEDDWQNWPTPPQSEVLHQPDTMDTIFRLYE